ncbi:inhibitor of nuclear factor kappa-B kinase subunit alpha-like [Euroglyphus maynei]|uniref:IkappaB kinase n=1 Tax=Euroglyphus maynei TaxID=6958 RepID=A0A1Y3AVK8_EURMA|nr:inhibitor of nuclear factor kappa-B kinase subunit alpha-like [Euroglyphus maynei]
MHHCQQKLLNDIGSVNNWQRVQILGSGTFATITLWVNKETDEKIALKQSYMDVERYGKKEIAYYHERWQQEIKLMKKLQCVNVVKALKLPDEFIELSIEMPILAMEYCSGGDLRKVLNESANCCGLSEKEVREILRQISSAIICLHDLNIVHRDLKPENIVLQPLPHGKILYKLTDLGFAKQLSDTTSAHSLVGTFAYSAPELFLNTPYTSSVDNWSFGVIAYEIVTGRRPFLPNHPVTEVLEAIKKKKSDDICTEIDERGNFYYSKEISQINHISNNLKNDLEQWLKVSFFIIIKTLNN